MAHPIATIEDIKLTGVAGYLQPLIKGRGLLLIQEFKM